MASDQWKDDNRLLSDSLRPCQNPVKLSSVITPAGPAECCGENPNYSCLSSGGIDVKPPPLITINLVGVERIEVLFRELLAVNQRIEILLERIHHKLTTGIGE